MKNGKENIFIHIPKTGGTTIITSINNTYWASEPNFYYRHIIAKTKFSNSGDIFEPENHSKYKNYTIFMMVRHPVDRMISEYYFLRERKNFMSHLKKPPNDFEDFILNPQTQNYMVGFLAGRRLYDTQPATGKDLERVISAIDAIPIHVGIFEFFEESLLYFQQVASLTWNKTIDVKRMTFLRPEADELDEKLKMMILEKNQLDKKLYDYCLAKFLPVTHRTQSGKIRFIKSKYNHVIPYVMQICLFEFCTENKFFLTTHLSYFKDLTFYILNHLKVRDGKTFVLIWNATFLKTIESAFPGSPFFQALANAVKNSNEPIEQTSLLGKAMDSFFNTQKSASVYFKPMKFDPSIVVIPEEKKEKASFLKSIFPFLNKSS